jgi:hypothetical protein
MRAGLAAIFAGMTRLGTRIAAAAVVVTGAGFAALMGGTGAGFADGYGPTNTPPDCSGVHASLSTLNNTGKFIKVTLSGATDADGDALTYSIIGVTQDEKVVGPPGTTSPDAMRATSSDSVLLRAERDPMGDGRIYTISYSVSDGEDSCTDTTTVAVPRKKGEKAVLSPASYDSFTGDPV